MIEKSYDDVWSDLIEYASSHFFAIDNFEKESGLMTLTFGASEAARFIDCGQINSPIANYEGSYVQYVEQHFGGSLDGRMNLTVINTGPEKTKVMVNARYVFSTNVGPNQGRNQTWAFNTGNQSVVEVSRDATASDATRTCRPTYEAERAIIDGITRTDQAISSE